MFISEASNELHSARHVIERIVTNRSILFSCVLLVMTINSDPSSNHWNILDRSHMLVIATL